MYTVFTVVSVQQLCCQFNSMYYPTQSQRQMLSEHLNDIQSIPDNRCCQLSLNSDSFCLLIGRHQLSSDCCEPQRGIPNFECPKSSLTQCSQRHTLKRGKSCHLTTPISAVIGPLSSCQTQLHLSWSLPHTYHY